MYPFVFIDFEFPSNGFLTSFTESNVVKFYYELIIFFGEDGSFTSKLNIIYIQIYLDENYFNSLRDNLKDYLYLVLVI